MHLYPVEISPWQEWSPCSVTCGEGKHLRRRTCTSLTDACNKIKLTDSGICHGEEDCPSNKQSVEVWQWTALKCDAFSKSTEAGADGLIGAPAPFPAEGVCTPKQGPVTTPCRGGTEPSAGATTLGPESAMSLHARVNLRVHDSIAQLCTEPVLVDGHWTEWDHWAPCDVTCSTGNQKKSRTCDNPAPKFQGRL